MYLGKEVKVFLKDQAKEKYYEPKDKTDKESSSILNSIERAKQILKVNPQYGNTIKKKLIPKQLFKLGIKNLYRVELSNYWRLLYTIEGNGKEIFVFILIIMNHRDYNKLFGYK